MEKINTGGAAFPRPMVQPNHITENFDLYMAQTGMSLRDYIAIHATTDDIEMYVDNLTREQAKYYYADRMLEARNDQKGWEENTNQDKIQRVDEVQISTFKTPSCSYNWWLF